jgi:GT2 family glycosyltransferase
MAKTLVVSVINFRTAEMTIACVGSVLQDMQGVDGHVVIVDNLSEDGSAEHLAEWIESNDLADRVSLVRSPTNSGFSGGHNQGMSHVAAAHYLLLNSDAVLRPGFIAEMLTAASEAPDAGFYAPRLTYEDGTVQDSAFRFHGPLSELIRASRSGPITRLLKRHEVALGPNPAESDVDWVSFACVMLNGRMVREIGPMDEGYFLYYEDAEYCLRARRKGWRVKLVPTASAVHFRGGSGPVKALARSRDRLPRYYYSSRTRFLYQAHGMSGLFAANALYLVGRGMFAVSRMLGLKRGIPIAAEWRDIWINALKPLGPRYAPWERS